MADYSFLHLVPKSIPEGNQDFPEDLQALLDLLAQYLEIGGIASNNGDDIDDPNAESTLGIIVSNSIPGADKRHLVWMEVTQQRKPVALRTYHENTGKWEPLRTQVPVVETQNRPSDPKEGDLIYDKTLKIFLGFERGTWRAGVGLPKGALQFVSAPTADAAEDSMPGWTQLTDASGRAIVAAGAGQGLTERYNGDKFGSEKVELEIEHLPSHSHAPLRSDSSDPGDNPKAGPGPYLPNVRTGASVGKQDFADSSTGLTGGDEPHDNIPPSYAAWLLIKG